MVSTRSFLTFNPDLEALSSVDTVADADGAAAGAAPADLPLQHHWKVWEQIENESQKDYTNNMKPIASFSTVHDFWHLWNRLPQPSQLMADKRMVRQREDGVPQMVDAIMIFRDEVQPMWEDRLNANGGHFEIRYAQTRDADEQARLDEHWNNIVLGMVGATIEPEGMVTGVRLVDKLHAAGRSGGFIRIEIWFTEVGVPDGRQQLRANIEKFMVTKLDGTRDTTRIQLTMKSHQKGK